MFFASAVPVLSFGEQMQQVRAPGAPQPALSRAAVEGVLNARVCCRTRVRSGHAVSGLSLTALSVPEQPCERVCVPPQMASSMGCRRWPPQGVAGIVQARTHLLILASPCQARGGPVLTALWRGAGRLRRPAADDHQLLGAHHIGLQVHVRARSGAGSRAAQRMGGRRTPHGLVAGEPCEHCVGTALGGTGRAWARRTSWSGPPGCACGRASCCWPWPP